MRDRNKSFYEEKTKVCVCSQLKLPAYEERRYLKPDLAGKQAVNAKTAHESSHLGELTWSEFIHLETTKMLRL